VRPGPSFLVLSSSAGCALLATACCGGASSLGAPAEPVVGPIPERFMELQVVPASPEGPTGEDADWLRASASRGLGHCATDEIVLFDCGVDGDKRLSLCGSDTLATVQYRFGPLGAPELVYPGDGSRDALSYGNEVWARGAEDSVSFTRGEHTYRLVDASGSGIDGPANNYQGVKVFQAQEELAFVACTTETTSELTRAESILGGTP